jgi:hypothetical protein
VANNIQRVAPAAKGWLAQTQKNNRVRQPIDWRDMPPVVICRSQTPT